MSIRFLSLSANLTSSGVDFLQHDREKIVGGERERGKRGLIIYLHMKSTYKLPIFSIIYAMKQHTEMKWNLPLWRVMFGGFNYCAKMVCDFWTCSVRGRKAEKGWFSEGKLEECWREIETDLNCWVGKVDEVWDVERENLNPETPKCISKLLKTPHQNSATFLPCCWCQKTITQLIIIEIHPISRFSR
jgi:hypothetical protein